MLRYKFNELLRQKSFSENRDLTINIIMDEARIGYATISKLKNSEDSEYYFSTIILDKLCTWFECDISDLVEYIPPKKRKRKRNIK